MSWPWFIALHGTERGTPPEDTVYLGAVSLPAWERVSVLGDSTVWTKLATNGDDKAVLGAGTSIAVSTNSGETWSGLTSASNIIAELKGLKDGSIWGILNNGTLLRFASDLSGYTEIVPGGATVNCSTYCGIASDGGSTIVAVADGMNRTISTDGGASFGTWASAGQTLNPQDLHHEGGFFVAPGVTGNTVHSASGSSWSALTVTTPPGSPSTNDPFIVASVPLPDRVLLVADHVSGAANRYAVYYTTATDLVYWLQNRDSVNGGPEDNLFSYIKEYSYEGAVPGTASQQKDLSTELLQNEGTPHRQTSFFTTEQYAMWWGNYGLFYTLVSGPTTAHQSDDFRCEPLVMRTDPDCIRAIRQVKRSVMPRPSMLVDIGEYATRFGYSY